MAAEALAMDYSGQHHTPRRHTQGKHHAHISTNGAPYVQSPKTQEERSPSSNSATDEDGTEESDDGQGADTDDPDEEEDDDSDKEAVLAPSDCEASDQAGPTVSIGDDAASSRQSHDSGSQSKPRSEREPSNLQPGGMKLVQDADDDEEIYNAVDDISESDGDDPGAEEEALMLMDFEMSMGDGLGPYHPDQFAGDVPYFDEQLRLLSYSNRVDIIESKPSTPTLHAIARMPSPPPPTPTTATRRVHFDTSTLGADMPDPCDQGIATPHGMYLDEEYDSSSASGTGYESG